MKITKYIDLTTIEGRQQFYQTKEWRAIRLVALSLNPYCVECAKNGSITLGTEVDHIIDIKDAPERFMDLENLQVLCKSCHGKKTIQSNMFKTVNVKFNPSHKKWNF